MQRCQYPDFRQWPRQERIDALNDDACDDIFNTGEDFVLPRVQQAIAAARSYDHDTARQHLTAARDQINELLQMWEQ